ncbi:MAG: hypothetical protein ACRC8M_01800 [Cetobacterium sp.]|uniref:hypothetical protein n=1 Tax=Cetobacterium sp. TaxID=2071632 RepID=UPI003F3C02A7
MRLKIMMFLFLINILVFSHESLIITEKQGFNFSTVIKTTSLKKVRPIENLILNIKGKPYSEIKVTLDDYYEVADDVYIGDIFLLTSKNLFLDKNGELDIEITGNLYVLEKAKSKKGKERFRSPLKVEYK